MFQLYVEVEGHVRAVEFVAFAVRTLKLFLDLDRQSSILLPVLEFVEAEVVFLEALRKIPSTSISFTNSWSSLVRSDNSLMRAKLS